MEIDDQETTDSPNDSQTTSDENLWPPWVKPLLETTSFFTRCGIHKKYKCDLFCIDCCGLGFGALCLDCIAPEHQDHKLIEVARLPRNVPGLEASDLDNTMEQLDITGVFQRGGLIYLNKRPYPHSGSPMEATSTSCCRVCRSFIPVNYRFCCLSCKVEGTPPQSPSPPPSSSPPPPAPPAPPTAEETRAAEVPATGTSKRSEARRKKRKGIPHRSPRA